VRLILSIVSFVLAGILITLGIVLRSTTASPPTALEFEAETSGTAPITIIDGATLNAIEGRQTITISDDGPIVAAYGRTADVLAWVGDASYNTLRFEETEDGERTLVAETQRGSETEVPNPAGSDLWLDDFAAEDDLRLSVTLQPDMSFIIASDGAEPAPSNVVLEWPVADTGAPAIAPLFIGGAALLIAGLVLLFMAVYGMRGKHGPRRKMPKVPRKRAIKTLRGKPRSASKRIGAGVGALLVAAALTTVPIGATGARAAETPTPTPTPPANATPVPALTERQIDRVVDRVLATMRTADANRDAALAETRMTGPALELKLADYALQGADPALATSSPVIPEDAVVAVRLPQQVPLDVESWPRTVFVVVASPEALDEGGASTPDPSATEQPEEAAPPPPVAMVLTQDEPRANYRVSMLVALQEDVPEVAAPTVGAARLADESPLLSMAPADVTPAYVDILVNGEQSASFERFDLADDKFLAAWGLEAQQALIGGVPAPGAMSISTTEGTGPLLALATVEAGAIVTGTVRQVVEVYPTEEGATVSSSGAVRTLAGVETSGKGFTATYAGQLLYIVPPVDSSGPVVVLGYAQGLVAAGERP